MPLKKNKLGFYEIEGTNNFLVPGSVWSKYKEVVKSPSGKKSQEIWGDSDITRNIRKAGGIFVNDAFIDLWDKEDGILFLYGGYGSSKTTYIITKYLMLCRFSPYFKCYYGRQVKTIARELHDSIIIEIERNGWQNEFHYSTTQTGFTQIVHKKTKNRFQLFGCNDDESLKGIAEPTHILIDEVNQISFESFGMLITRLRGMGKKTQIAGCFNNSDVFEEDWLKKYFFGGDSSKISREDLVMLKVLQDMNCVKHHSIYTDNKFQNPHQYVQKLIIKAKANMEIVNIYCEGGWGIKVDRQPYYKNFSFNRDVYDSKEEIFEVRKDAPLLVSFDENANPYYPCLIAQREGNNLYVFDEIAGINPNNTVMYLTDEINKRYLDYDIGCKVFGDATSRRHDVGLEEGTNRYTVICSLLKKFQPKLCVPLANPNNSDRQDFINLILKTNYGGIKIFISNKCRLLIKDLNEVMEHPERNANGKSKGKDKSTKMVNGIRGVQPIGHLGDCFSGETMIETIYGEKRIDLIQIGDLVLTRDGYKKVTKVWDRGYKKVYKNTINQIETKSTINHKYFTTEYGFMEIGKIKSATFCFLLHGAIAHKIFNKMCDVKISSNWTFEKVYDISVEDKHEFFANGILVHNCLEYMICYEFAEQYNRMKAGDYTFAPKQGGRIVKNIPDMPVEEQKKIAEKKIFKRIISRNRMD